MKIEIKDLDKDFIEILKEIKTEKVEIKNDEIILEEDSLSKLRARINLIFRLLYIYQSFNKII